LGSIQVTFGMLCSENVRKSADYYSAMTPMMRYLNPIRYWIHPMSVATSS